VRILGGHDYYDGAGWGVDTQTTFVRSNPDTVWEGPPGLALHTGLWRGLSLDEVALAFGVVFVGGTLVPFVEERRALEGRRWYPHEAVDGTTPWKTRTRFLYSVDEGIDLVERIYGAKQAHRRTFALHPNADAPPANLVAQHFARTEATRDETDWAIRHRVVTAVARWWQPQGGARSKTPTHWVNTPTLKDVESWKGIDPATAHMRIASWLGGVLPHHTPTVELSDRSKIAKAGFDKRSFRKDPSHLGS
jgi:hypothetical protein